MSTAFVLLLPGCHVAAATSSHSKVLYSITLHSPPVLVARAGLLASMLLAAITVKGISCPVSLFIIACFEKGAFELIVGGS